MRPAVLARPAVIYLVLLTQVPLVFTLYYATLNWNLMRPAAREFAGLGNFISAVAHPDFWPVIWTTVQLTVSVVVISLILGMALALLLNRQFAGRGLVRTLLITPFLFMPTVAAVLWKNVLYNPAFGLFSVALAPFRLGGVDWLAQYPLAAVTAIIVWQWTPFMMLILLAGLQALPPEQVEAAQMDGAGPLAIFRYITVPHLGRYIEIAVLLALLFILSLFAEIFVATSGGPGIATTNLTYHIYKEAFERWNIGRASAIGVMAIILANLLVLLFLRILRREIKRGDSA